MSFIDVRGCQTNKTAGIKPEIGRRYANFHPSIWAEEFSNVSSNEEADSNAAEKQIEELKSETRKKLAGTVYETQFQQLEIVDAIQNLGLDYHFVTEIKEILEHIFNTRNGGNDDDGACDLYLSALRFRLLRQQGYNVLCDVFSKFKNIQGNFKDELLSDPKGILSLYEATQLRANGETILDEAYIFAYTHLKSVADQLSQPLQSQVIHALKYPIHKTIPRLKARKYITIYEENDSHNPSLLRFAKLDFNRLQKQHQQELMVCTRWWKDLDFTTTMSFARDRMAESYFWALSFNFEPQYHFCRIIVAKFVAWMTVLDDIYDVHGTPDEIRHITMAMDRWDITMVENQPEYMRIVFETLLDILAEIEVETAKRGTSDRVHYVKEANQKMAKAYYEESKWLTQKYVPDMEEYMRVASITAATDWLTTIVMVAMDVDLPKDSYELIFSVPKAMEACNVIGRLTDDIASHEFEQQREHIASAVECFMKQYSVSKEEAREELSKLVDDAWKDLNEECFKLNPNPNPVALRMFLNYARSIHVVYIDGDGFTNSTLLKANVSDVLKDPVPI